MKIILVNLVVSREHLRIILRFIFFVLSDINNEPRIPRDAASDGVAIPAIIDPRTNTINNKGGAIPSITSIMLKVPFLSISKLRSV